MKDDMMSFCDFFMSNLTESSVNHKWNELEKALKSTMERNISIKTSSSRFNRPRFNRTQGRLCRKKQRLYNAAKMTQTWPNIDQWRKNWDRNLRRQEMNTCRAFIRCHPGKFEVYLVSYKRRPKVVAKMEFLILKSMEVWQANFFCKAKALNDQFCSVFTKENTFIYPVLPPSNCTTEKRPIRVSCKGVKKQLQGLKCDKAPGPDGIPPWILQMLHLKISPILTEIFQSSLCGSWPWAHRAEQFANFSHSCSLSLSRWPWSEWT